VYDYYRVELWYWWRRTRINGRSAERQAETNPRLRVIWVGGLFHKHQAMLGGLIGRLRFTRVPATIVFEFRCRLELIRGGIHRSVPFFIGIVVCHFDVRGINSDVVSC
jgi:hypothetical protein